MIKRFFQYKFSDGTSKACLEPFEAALYCQIHGVTITEDGEEICRKTRRRVQDGFQPGWNPSLGCNVESIQQHRRLCKERGMVEVDPGTKPTFAMKAKPRIDESMIRQLNNIGSDISDREADALIKGETLHPIPEKELAKDYEIENSGNENQSTCLS